MTDTPPGALKPFNKGVERIRGYEIGPRTFLDHAGFASFLGNYFWDITLQRIPLKHHLPSFVTTTFQWAPMASQETTTAQSRTKHLKKRSFVCLAFRRRSVYANVIH
jgi:hypothetical protein